MGDGKSSSTTSAYVVLEWVEDTGAWKELKRVDATSSDQALRKGLGENAAGLFVAVPARSWQPKKRKVETVKKVIWS